MFCWLFKTNVQALRVIHLQLIINTVVQLIFFEPFYFYCYAFKKLHICGMLQSHCILHSTLNSTIMLILFNTFWLSSTRDPCLIKIKEGNFLPFSNGNLNYLFPPRHKKPKEPPPSKSGWRNSPTYRKHSETFSRS